MTIRKRTPQAMKIPDDCTCRKLLEEAATPIAVRDHCESVARLAMHITALASANGFELDVPAVRAAALLHDISRTERDHASAGAAFLAKNGYDGIADIVRRHMDPALIESLTDESAVLYLADKMTDGTNITPVERRLASSPEHKRAFAQAKLQKAVDIRSALGLTDEQLF